jgi:hypothetical protein
MPDIPEASGANSAPGIPSPPKVVPPPPTAAPMVGTFRPGTERGSNDQEVLGGRLDPRTGIISPQAVARDSALERGELPRQY